MRSCPFNYIKTTFLGVMVCEVVLLNYIKTPFLGVMVINCFMIFVIVIFLVIPFFLDSAKGTEWVRICVFN